MRRFVAASAFLLCCAASVFCSETGGTKDEENEALPPPPKALPAEVSPFEPRWFSGPGVGTVYAKGTTPTKGKIKLEADKILIDTAAITINVKLANVEKVVWEGVERFSEADKLLAEGLYTFATLKYAQTINEAKESLKASGIPENKIVIEGQWYAKGRMDECQLKADHIDYCALVFESPLATAQQLNDAAKMYLKLSFPGSTRPDRDAALDALVSGGKVSLSAEELARFDAIKRRGGAAIAAKVKTEPIKAQASSATTTPSVPAKISTAIPSHSSSSSTAPALKPEIMALTTIGGVGDQWIQEVGFTADGQIFAKGTGFTTFYSRDGMKFISTGGDVNTPSTGPKGRSYAIKKTFVNPFDQSKWDFGYKQVHKILQQPYLVSPSGWKWWNWTHEPCKEKELMADSRGFSLIFPVPGKFVAAVWRDGGNSSITRDPRDLEKKNRWTHRGGGSASYYMLGDCTTGEPLAGINFAHRPGAELVDPWGRVYIAQTTEGRPDDFKLGSTSNQGLSVWDAGLKSCLFNASLGAGRCHSMALRDNMLVIGGVVGADVKLPLKNPAQDKPGEGEDGFLAIIRLW